MTIICDTDFLSSLLKIERLELVKDFFKEENLYIPVAVLGEIAKTDLVTDLLDKNWIKVKRVNYHDLKKKESDEEFKTWVLVKRSVWFYASSSEIRCCL